ncbi:hypothetical protein HRI96_08860 [Treponema parvum]|uniref:Transglutaminase-like domain-containing protein n=1 Tax=Treponema parvum TaxID=138851 RepID=A0A975ID17_9SPIR|nr:hypothetical protein [Treponema parvum]QTQ12298.1 hypothetical protein HRI96_08860 [Treponema parvum]
MARQNRDTDASIKREIMGSAFWAHYHCLDTVRRGGCKKECDRCLLNVSNFKLKPEEEASVIFDARNKYRVDRERKQYADIESTAHLIVSILFISLTLFIGAKIVAFLKAVGRAIMWNETVLDEQFEPVTEADDEVPTWEIGIYKDMEQKNGKMFFFFLQDDLDTVRECVTDRIKDGKINCMDYAIAFYILANNSRAPMGSARIIANDKINHVFIGVIIDNEWVFIEPQAKSADWCRMEQVWKDRTDLVYDPRYNYDVTEYMWHKYKFDRWDNTLLVRPPIYNGKE